MVIICFFGVLVIILTLTMMIIILNFYNFLALLWPIVWFFFLVMYNLLRLVHTNILRWSQTWFGLLTIGSTVGLDGSLVQFSFFRYSSTLRYKQILILILVQMSKRRFLSIVNLYYAFSWLVLWLMKPKKIC